MKSFMGMLLQQ